MEKRARGRTISAGFGVIELLLTAAFFAMLFFILQWFYSYLKEASKPSEAAVNIKAIADGAIAWYDAEHADMNGDPMPKHFPCSKSPYSVCGKIWDFSIEPRRKPCSNGKPFYEAGEGKWYRSPWRQLKFAIIGKHYFRYTYGTKGIGVKAVVDIEANADLDCDGKWSSFTQKLSIDPATGEIKRSQLIIKNERE